MSIRCSSIRVPAMLAVLSVLLGACTSDTPTAVAPPASHPGHFTVAPDGGSIAASATFSAAREWPTIARRQTYPVAGSMVHGSGPVAASTDNSPFDLTTFGGPVLTGGTNWNLYMNCPTTPVQCWGSSGLSPSDFIQDLNGSRYMQILDQYIGQPAWRQWGFNSLTGNDPNIPQNNNLATQSEIYSILLSAAQFTGQSGYTTVYHVFLPQGVDMCRATGSCYSPDNLSTFVFCAFHGSVTFTDGTHIVYSVEPYQGVDGCQNPNGLPHGVIDATGSTLAHEFFEAVTDPDLDAWFNGFTGAEIADLCSIFEYDELLAARYYQIQTMYSNNLHACTDNAP